jgi:DNA-damage-inducible protein D
MNLKEILVEVEKNISKAELEKAIRKLIEHFNTFENPADEEAKRELLLISAQYSYFEKNVLKGICSEEEQYLRFNKINNQFLAIFQSLKDSVKDSPKNTIYFTPNIEEFVTVELTLNKHIDDFSISEQKMFLDKIKTALLLGNSLKIKNVAVGSIKITIEIPKNKAKDLDIILRGQDFSEFEITQIHIRDTEKTAEIFENEILPYTGINFQEKPIRKIFHNEEWWFSIIDVISVLTDSKNPSSYWSMVKNQAKDVALVSHKLRLSAQDNKQYLTDCANTEGIFRIIMAIPSPKAEPFKQWLAEMGREAIDEIENSELDFERMKDLYKAKGYTFEWIQQRISAIDTRKSLTQQWKARGVNEGQEFSILTTEISKNTFGLTPYEYRQFKGLDHRYTLRDNMTDTELYFAALGEQYTLKEILDKNAFGFRQNQDAAILGGILASKELKKMEQKQGIKVISNRNFMNLLQGGDMQRTGQLS